MAICNLCADVVDDSDIIVGLCSNCYEIYQTSDYSTPGTEAFRLNKAARRRNLSFTYTYSMDPTTNNNCPAAGRVRRNSPTPASVTQIQIDKSDSTGNFNLSHNFSLMITGDLIYLQDAEGNTTYEIYEITSTPIDNGSCYQFPCIRIDDNGTISSNNDLTVTISVSIP